MDLVLPLPLYNSSNSEESSSSTSNPKLGHSAWAFHRWSSCTSRLSLGAHIFPDSLWCFFENREYAQGMGYQIRRGGIPPGMGRFCKWNIWMYCEWCTNLSAFQTSSSVWFLGWNIWGTWEGKVSKGESAVDPSKIIVEWGAATSTSLPSSHNPKESSNSVSNPIRDRATPVDPFVSNGPSTSQPSL